MIINMEYPKNTIQLLRKYALIINKVVKIALYEKENNDENNVII
jgi:hypothetical protein